VTVPLRTAQPDGLAVLGIILTATPEPLGSTTIRRGTLLLHVLDLVDENAWLTLIKTRYEHLLLEIFE
jgi:multicomponent K+:H+ antiporter subunit E